MPSDKMASEPPKRLCVAKVASPHGVKGLVKLHVFVEDINLLNGPLFTDESGNDTLTITPKNAVSKHWVAEIDGSNDRDKAEELRGTCFYIEREALPETKENEFYASDLIGLNVMDEDNKAIGKVIAVENFGAGDLLEIQPDGTESFYLPFNKETVPNITETTVIVRIPENLI